MAPTPVFTAEGKFYPSEQTGELLPSVSTVLSTCYPNYGAIAWSKKEIAAGRDPNRHARRGTMLHAIAEDYLKCDRVSPSTPRYSDPEIEPWIETLLEGLRTAVERLGKAMATEHYIEASWYGGTLDALLESGTVLDIKTVQALGAWTTGRDWRQAAPSEKRAWLQVLGYCNAADLADEELCSGVTQGALLVVSPEAYVLKRAAFEDRELERWCEPEGDLFVRYGEALRRREQQQARLGERGSIASKFGFL